MFQVPTLCLLLFGSFPFRVKWYGKGLIWKFHLKVEKV